MASVHSSMKAITYSQPGDSSVLSLAEKPLPEPGPGEVRVRVVVSGVNPTDWKARATTGRPLPFDEVTPNQDGSGVVDAVGDGVTDLTVGQRVWIYLAAHQRPFGTAAEYTILPAARAVPLADDASFELGASLGVPAMTAHRALTVHEDGPSRLAPGALAGRTVLVQGGAGAVGHAAIQLAVWAGATVIATVSSDEKEALRARPAPPRAAVSERFAGRWHPRTRPERRRAHRRGRDRRQRRPRRRGDRQPRAPSATTPTTAETTSPPPCA